MTAGGGRRSLRDVPGALRDDAVVRRVASGRVAVFLDYDGTLTPIVDHPGDAVLSAGMREAVSGLAARCTVCIVTGRDLSVIRDLLGLDDIILAANHGFDVWSPATGTLHRSASDDDRRLIRSVEAELRAAVAGIPGAVVEPKASSVAAHHRQVAPERRAEVAAAVDRVVASHPGRLRVTPGKMVHEIQPDIGWDKGRAVLHLLATLPAEGADVTPLYIGDDITDEDAFAAIAGRGVGVIVGRPGDPETGDRDTAADYRLDSVDEVLELLVRLTAAIGAP